MWQTDVNPMPVGMFTRSKKLLQLLRGPVDDAVLAIEGAQGPIKGMPLTKPISSDVDQHEVLTMLG